MENFKDMKFDLETRDEFIALLAQCLQGTTADLPRAKGYRPAILELELAQQPAGVGRPGQHPKGRRVGAHQHVRGALHLGYADAAAGREGRKHGAVRRVLQQQRARDGHAAFEGGLYFGSGKRLAAQHPVLIGEREAHGLETARLDLLEDIHAAQADWLRRRASQSFQYSSMLPVGPMPSIAGGPFNSTAFS